MDKHMKPNTDEVLNIMKEDEEGYKHFLPVVGRGREHVLFDRMAFGSRPRTEFIVKHLLK